LLPGEVSIKIKNETICALIFKSVPIVQYAKFANVRGKTQLEDLHLATFISK